MLGEAYGNLISKNRENIEIIAGNDQNNFRAIPKLVDPEGAYKLQRGYIFGNKNMVTSKGNLVVLPIYSIMFA